MSAVDWVCQKISLESASEQLSAITISRQRVLSSKHDACATLPPAVSIAMVKDCYFHMREGPDREISCICKAEITVFYDLYKVFLLLSPSSFSKER